MTPAEIIDAHAFALALAKSAGRRALAGWRGGIVVAEKPDGSLVTPVDQAIERAWRQALHRRYPGHGVVGEEYGEGAGDGDCEWILDPIDGTDNYVHGIPTFGSLITLRVSGSPVVAVISHPALREVWSAMQGQGVFLNGSPRRVLTPQHGRHPIIVTTAPENFVTSGQATALAEIQRAFPNSRIYRDCFAHSRVVRGSAAAGIDAGVQLWDIAGLPLFMAESGRVCETFATWADSAGRERYTVVFGDAVPVSRLAGLMKGDTPHAT